MAESFTELLFSTYSVSFLTDDIIRLRYVEIEGQLRKVLMVVKMRGGAHSHDIREYEITNKGVEIGKRLTGYEHLITGIPRRVDAPGSEK
jgi:circadian clock protein KaiC